MCKALLRKSFAIVLAIMLIASMVPTYVVSTQAANYGYSASNEIELQNGPDYTMETATWWNPNLSVATAKNYTVSSSYTKIKFNFKLPDVKTLEPIMVRYASLGGDASTESTAYGNVAFAIYFTGAKRVGVTQEDFYAALKANKEALANGETVQLQFNLSGKFTDGAVISGINLMVSHPNGNGTAFAGKSVSISDVEFPCCVETLPLDLQNGSTYTMNDGYYTIQPNLIAPTSSEYTISANYSCLRMQLTLPNVNDVLNKFEWGSIGGNSNSDTITYGEADFAIYFTGTKRVGVTQAIFRQALTDNIAELAAGKTVDLELPLSGRFTSGNKISGINFMFNHKSSGIAGKQITISSLELVSFNSETELRLNGGSTQKLNSNDGWHPQLTTSFTSSVNVSSDLTQISFDLVFPSVKTLRPLMSHGSKGGNYSSDSISYGESDYAIYFSGVTRVGVTQEDFFKALDENADALAKGKVVKLRFKLSGKFPANGTITALNMMVAHQTSTIPISSLAAFDNASITFGNLKLISDLGHNEVSYAAKAGTCVEKGWNAYTACSRCDYSTQFATYGEHNIVTAAAVAPTCTKTGLTEGKKCSLCDYFEVNQKTIAATGHSYKSQVIAPGCTSQGYDQYTCTVCGYIEKTNFVSATGHKVVTDAAVAPTCTQTGLTAGKHCSVCKLTLETQKVVAAKGHSYTSKVTAPSCTTQGYTTYTCTACNDSYKSNYVAAKGHSYTSKVTAPTCTAKGYTTYTCATCKESYVSDYVNAKGHSYTSKVTAPTCTTQGYTTYTCSVCGDSYKADYVNALGHTVVIKNAVAPTCTKPGLTEGKYCSVCKVVLLEQTAVAAKGHSYTSKVTAPTCTAEGYTTYTCTACNDSYKSNYVAAKGHSYTSNITAPTCTAKGYTTYTCAICNDSYESDYVNATGHSYTSKVTAPTCTAEGYTTYTCSICGDRYKADYVNALGHTVVIKNAVAPTCTTSGITEGRHCSVCEVILLEQTVVEAKGHSYTSKVTAPTCTDKGYTTYTCADCNDGYISNYVGAKGHTEVVDYGVEPTCTTTGLTEGKHCKACGEVIIAQMTIMENGHTEVVDRAVEPTYTTSGLTEGKHCIVCDEVIVAQEEIPAKEYILGDADENGVVDICDLVKLQNAILDREEYSVLVDMNKDSEINSLDLIALKKLLWLN